ncbi:hypothetical protein SAMN05216223_10846 [Actinacidiphila yanglinensis]|uniref:Preprotein translocase subunit SecD n=1 Tax=Actinacidiphila yanglinensis TaxID=310779 RepID=A0A1H6C4P0_9ACTN|nr:hypothetical protein [Actinacidiphila yanglinensis]SEG67960.1 hypothetical protein SAMN05216223_10846 [Actinacidiphila yanglinensis]
MNESTEHPLDGTLHDLLHAQVRDGEGNAAGPHLVGLADGALRIAGRRRRYRAGAGVIAVAVLATVGVAVASGTTGHTNGTQPAAEGTGPAALLSILPVSSVTERACVPGSGGFTVPAATNHPTYCVSVDRSRGMTDVRVASAKADRSATAGTWQVEVTFFPADRARYTAFTGSLATHEAPTNEFALVVDGKLWGTPLVDRAITSVDIVGWGDLTSAATHHLADRLTGRA